ncbi:MAG: hypothetical protein J5753_06330, partial [Oscillospiraceae bacterium]|nr:hypothetical protein [Oscillospiraceae bacterium]
MKRDKRKVRRKQRTQLSDSMMKTAFIFGGGLVVAVLGLVAFSVATGRGQSKNIKASGGIDYAVSKLEVWEGEELPSADTFLYDNTRSLVQESRYLVAPEVRTGDQDVAILMQLEDGTIRTENAVLSVRERVLHYELGSETTAQELLGRGFEEAVVSKPLTEFAEIGSYPLTVTVNGREREFTLIVQDTVAPVVTFQDSLKFYLNQKLTVMDFV